jgi:hypothetical protein
MRSNDCTRNSSAGSKLRPFYHQRKQQPCCFGRCWLQGRSQCAKSMAGKTSAKSPSIRSLTSPHDPVTSSCSRLRQNKFQPKSRRHPSRKSGPQSSLPEVRRINAAKETLQFASGTGFHPTTRRSPTAWAWDYQSAARSSKITEDGCGRLGIGQGVRYFSLRSRSADVIRRSIRFCAVWPTLAASYPGG